MRVAKKNMDTAIPKRNESYRNEKEEMKKRIENTAKQKNVAPRSTCRRTID